MQTRDYPLSTWKRFWAKVEEGEGGCWNWTASVLHSGYGQFYAIPDGCRRPREKYVAHRFAYECLVGPIPEGLQLDHLCRNRRCVNPTHLEPVTAAENLHRGNGFSGINFRKTHCIHGHELAGRNLYVTPQGKRNCMECRRQAAVRCRARAAERRAA